MQQAGMCLATAIVTIQAAGSNIVYSQHSTVHRNCPGRDSQHSHNIGPGTLLPADTHYCTALQPFINILPLATANNLHSPGSGRGMVAVSQQQAEGHNQVRPVHRSTGVEASTHPNLYEASGLQTLIRKFRNPEKTKKIVFSIQKNNSGAPHICETPVYYSSRATDQSKRPNGRQRHSHKTGQGQFTWKQSKR
ncbi:hypothetical protein AB205_0202220 [Aquarana catesbeiana]|uniref:Uncharacterized protein n=1 Tax=Aquarana catesbeiana TaxID=8400 RepID=A0A2G9Q5G9_AQUCT|nr:hypothetical protein AB205_0202220 [Aquarana catesbeiana]